MREKDPAAGPKRVKQDNQLGEVPPANLQQPGGGKGPSAQERQEDTGKTEAQDFFRQDKSGVPRQEEQSRPPRSPRGEDESSSGQSS